MELLGGVEVREADVGDVDEKGDEAVAMRSRHNRGPFCLGHYNDCTEC